MKKIVIGLLGETGSGKDTVANHLEEKYGAKLRRFANPIKDTLSIFFDKLSKKDQQWLYLRFRERFGEDILCRAMKKRIDSDKEELIVVNGLRMLCDYDFIKSYENSYVLYVTADEEIRWKRVVSRGEKTDDNISLEKFQEMEKEETEIHIPEMGKKADGTINNDKDVEYLLKETDKFMEEIKTGEAVKNTETPELSGEKKPERIESAGKMVVKPEFKKKTI